MKFKKKKIAIDKLHNSLLGYLAGHFKVNKGEISRHFLKSKPEDELGEELCERITHVLDSIDAVKYGDIIDTIEVKQLVNEVEFIISELSS